MNESPNNFGGEERRRYKRIAKQFILSYFDKTNPEQKYELTQIKNISAGGVCFITTQGFEPGTKIGMELRTPFIAETTSVEGSVIESREKVANMLYETRLEFDPLSEQAAFIMKKLAELF